MRIEDMSLEQLIELNEYICQRIDELRARADLNVLKQLRLGQVVHFEAPEGEIFGKVVKMNRKTVVVLSEDGKRWKVSAGLVKLLRDVRP
ncbi:MAG: transposase [Hahellaceae bacterium]|nr:transposase [Hahellaceae bacterium]MCP5169092.1 transposase [Hahellaceae bacterium]MCP5170109.1 transposase [Hahellaceae bacterium]